MGQSSVVEALRSLWDGDTVAAAEQAEQSRTSSLLATALADYLRTQAGGAATVYSEPQAFQAFIAGGGNVGLYEATSAALAGAYEGFTAPTILDIGCGDGAALVPAVQRASVTPRAVDLVEMSSALLDTAVQRLAANGVEATAHLGSAEDFVADLDDRHHWDIAESTFALHALRPERRTDVLRALSRHVRRLVVVEFDVASHEPGSDEHLHFLADSYEIGLAEYDADRTLVAGGFLMPVLVGQLTPGAVRATFEQPASAWVEQLTASGYTDVTCTALHPYWSSPAILLTAHGRRADGEAGTQV